MRLFISIILLTAASTFAHANEPFPEPFGLIWGMTESKLKEIGFSQVNESGGLAIYSSVTVPKAWSKAENYIAVTYKGRLVKAAANSYDFTDDILGSEGKGNYEQIKSLLTRKYGNPKSHYEEVGRKLYNEPDEFYQCLEYSGCGAYLSLYAFSEGIIAVQLNGKGRGEGYLTISYESPQFYVAKKEIERGNLKSDADAF